MSGFADQPDGKIVLGSDVHVALVPSLVDRPPGDQTRNKVVAVALTPVAVAGDAAGTGIAIGFVGAVIGIAIPVVIVIGIDYALHPPDKNCDHGNNNNAAPQEAPVTVQVPIYTSGEKPDQTAATQFHRWVVSFALPHSSTR